MNKILVIFFLLLQSFSFAQQKTGPTLCECAYAKAEEIELVKQCEKEFDQTSLSEERLKELVEEMNSCLNPSICDCQENKEDGAFQSKCKKTYNVASMTRYEKEEYQEALENCAEEKRNFSTFEVCECVNGDPKNEYLQSKCKELYDLKSMSEEERKVFVELMTECMENKDNEYFTLDICDCINVSKSDYELKENCLKKFDIKKITEEELKKIRLKAKDCIKN